VDIPETLAGVVRSYVAGISGYLFATAQGKPLQQRNVLRVLHGVKRVGLHAFRRFRLTWLRKNGVPKDLERYWMGHAPEEVGDLYSKLKKMLHSARSGLNAPGWALSWYTLVHKTQLLLKLQR
jgi:integrase